MGVPVGGGVGRGSVRVIVKQGEEDGYMGMEG